MHTALIFFYIHYKNFHFNRRTQPNGQINTTNMQLEF